MIIPLLLNIAKFSICGFTISIRIHMQMIPNSILKYTKTLNHKKKHPDDNFRIFLSAQKINTRSHSIRFHEHIYL